MQQLILGIGNAI